MCEHGLLHGTDVPMTMEQTVLKIIPILGPANPWYYIGDGIISRGYTLKEIGMRLKVAFYRGILRGFYY